MDSLSPAIQSYLGQLYAEGRRAYAFGRGLHTEFAAWARAARPVLLELLGLDPIRRDCGDFVPTVSLSAAEEIDGNLAAQWAEGAPSGDGSWFDPLGRQMAAAEFGTSPFDRTATENQSVPPPFPGEVTL